MNSLILKNSDLKNDYFFVSSLSKIKGLNLKFQYNAKLRSSLSQNHFYLVYKINNINNKEILFISSADTYKFIDYKHFSFEINDN